jgi:hypothetical protein
MNPPSLLASLLFLATVSLHAVPSPLKLAAVVDAANFPTLQAAFDAIPEAGGLVRLPPGDFELRAPLVLSTGNTRGEGSGAATHLINRNTTGEPALIVRPRDIAKNPRSRIWRVQLGNFRISGNTNSGDGVFAHGINEIFVQGLSVDHNGGNGIHLKDCYEDPRVSDSIITYNAKNGLLIDAGHDIVVNANQFEENQDAVRCVNSFNLCMNGNNIDDHLRHGVVIENTYGSVLSGNMIEECNGTAVILDRDCYGITVSANVIAHHLGGGVHLLDAWGCTVSANTFVLVHSNALFVGANSGRITVTGNTFCNSEIGGLMKRLSLSHTNIWARDLATGIALGATRDIVISGNTFSGLSGEAVLAAGKCERLSVLGNIITDCGRAFPKSRPLIHLNRARDSLERNNIVHTPPRAKPPK